MTENAENKSYGMEDYTDITPLDAQDVAKRRKRSIAIGVTLGLFISLFYITTITRLSENLKIRAEMLKKKSEIIQVMPKIQIASVRYHRSY